MRREPYAHNPFAWSRTPRTTDTRTLIKLREPLLFRLSRWYVNDPDAKVGIALAAVALILAMLAMGGVL